SRKEASSDSRAAQSFSSPGRSSNSRHTSPVGPRPYFGGSRMTPSYFDPRRTSRAAYFRASSTIQRTGRSARPDSSAFSRAHATDFLEASTWVTSAPAAAQARLATPVYPNRFRIFGL